MRIGGVIALLISLVIAVAATIWLRSSQNSGSVQSTVVVAASEIRSGQKLEPGLLRVIPWYNDTVPEGSFRRIEEIPWTENGPFAMSTIRKENLVIAGQLSGPNQRPTLSGLLSPGMVATTIQVNTISGVAGFVLPEERVDVILSRTVGGKKSAELIIENLRVLAVDSIVDPQGKPVPAKSVTFEINREDAQRLTLAASLGELTLALRSASSAGYSRTTRMSEADIGLSRKDNSPSGEGEGAGTDSNAAVDDLKKELTGLKNYTESGSQKSGGDNALGSSGVVDFTIVRGLSKDTHSIPAR